MGLANCVIHWYVVGYSQRRRQFLAAPRFKNLTTRRFIHPIDSLDKVARSLTRSSRTLATVCHTSLRIYIYTYKSATIWTNEVSSYIYISILSLLLRNGKVVCIPVTDFCHINRRVVIINKRLTGGKGVVTVCSGESRYQGWFRSLNKSLYAGRRHAFRVASLVCRGVTHRGATGYSWKSMTGLRITVPDIFFSPLCQQI